MKFFCVQILNCITNVDNLEIVIIKELLPVDIFLEIYEENWRHSSRDIFLRVTYRYKVMLFLDTLDIDRN